VRHVASTGEIRAAVPRVRRTSPSGSRPTIRSGNACL
jgi:hypothetical protein